MSRCSTRWAFPSRNWAIAPARSKSCQSRSRILKKHETAECAETAESFS
jgi:hypothetical protein